MRKFTFKSLFFLALLHGFSAGAFAEGRVPLGYGVSYFEDPSHSVMFEDILADAELDTLQWRASQQFVPNFGFSDSSFWLRVVIEESTLGVGKKVLELGYPMMDYVEFYVPDEKNAYNKVATGDSFTFSDRHFDHRFFAVPLYVGAGKKLVVYMRLQSRDTVIAPLDLWDEEAFYSYYENERYWLGIYYGAILSIVFYSLICWVVLRDRVFVLNVLLIATFCLIQLSLDGVGNALLWGDYPEFSKRIRPFSISLLSIGAIELTKLYFHRETAVPNVPWFYRLLYLGVAIGMIGAVVFPFTMSIKYSMAVILVALIPVLVTGYAELRSGSLIAKYFAAGWLFLVLGGVANVMRGFGVLPVNVVTVYGAQIGALMTMLLLSFGFTDRIRVLQKEVAEANKKALARERLTNRELDEKVQQRTLDLEKSHQIILQKNGSFKVLLETGVLMDHEQSLQSLLDLTVSQLVRVFPQNQFALLLNDGVLEETIKPIFHDVHFQQQKFLMRYHEHLLLTEEQNNTSDHEKLDGSLLEDLNVVPVRQGNDVLLGHVIMMGKTLNQSDKELLMVFVDQLSSFLKNKVLHDQLELLANKDVLTGTFSRAYFDNFYEKLVKEKVESNSDFALMLIDVNGLKYVNDVHGHNSGDLMLKMVASFLNEHVRGNDRVCRLGGDEFVIAVKGSAEEGQHLADKLMRKQQGMTLTCSEGEGEGESEASESVPVRFSLGCASTSDYECFELLKAADKNMYASKKAYYEKNPQALTRSVL